MRILNFNRIYSAFLEFSYFSRYIETFQAELKKRIFDIPFHFQQHFNSCIIIMPQAIRNLSQNEFRCTKLSITRVSITRNSNEPRIYYSSSRDIYRCRFSLFAP